MINKYLYTDQNDVEYGKARLYGIAHEMFITHKESIGGVYKITDHTKYNAEVIKHPVNEYFALVITDENMATLPEVFVNNLKTYEYMESLEWFKYDE